MTPSRPEDGKDGESIRRWSVPLILSLLALQTLAVKIFNLPLNRIIENRFCLAYYSVHDPSQIPKSGIVPERLCKVDDVQQSLAWLVGAIETFHLAIDLAMTLPLGAVSDKGYGRRVLALNFVGFFAMYAWLFIFGFVYPQTPSWILLIGPMLSIVGGGTCVFMSTISAMITVHVTSDIDRTTAFAYVSSVEYVMHLAAPSLAAITMSVRLWLPFMVGLALFGLGLPAVGLLPRTPQVNLDAAEGESNEPLLQDGEDDEQATPVSDDARRSTRKLVSKLFSLYRHIADRSNFQRLLGIFFVAALASSNSALFPQYISKRYNWTFAKAGYLLSVKALINMTLLGLVIPAVVKTLSKRYDFSSSQINKLGTQSMLGISVLGVLLIATASSVPYLVLAFFIYALGSGLPIFTLSLVKDPTSTGNGETNALDYSIVMIAKYAGNLVGLPFMTVLWANGIRVGKAALGLPYFASAVFYGIGVAFATRLSMTP